jgi:hypothetical protein
MGINNYWVVCGTLLLVTSGSSSSRVTMALTRGVSHCGLAIYIFLKKYLKAKEEL